MLSLLPPYEGKTVLEFGAGIGRFTGELAKKAGHVIALDFIDSVIKKVIHLLYLDNKFLIAERKICYQCLELVLFFFQFPICRMKK